MPKTITDHFTLSFFWNPIISRRILFAFFSLVVLCPITQADQVNFLGEFTAEFGSYGGISPGDAYSINIFYTSALSGSGMPTVVIDAAYLYVGAECWALSSGSPGITVDAATDTALFQFSVSDSTGSGFRGGSVAVTFSSADDVMVTNEATEENILSLLFNESTTGAILFAPGAPGFPEGILFGTAVAVPEPASVIASSGLGALIVASQIWRRKRQRSASRTGD